MNAPSPIRHLPAASFRRMPWKNGGGETIEIAAFPENAGLEGFDWRVSMARVAAAGPFSIFPETDRTLAVIEGGALLLHFAPHETVPLTQDSEPFFFPADVPVSATLPAGAITDLNVMTRRGRQRHLLRRLRADLAGLSLPIEGDEMLLLAKDGALTLQADGQRLHLSSGDAAILSGAAPATTIVPEAATSFYAVSFWRTAQ
jgi:environmental stress-induced protein Ves